MKDYDTIYGRGHFETRDDALVTLTATTPTQVAVSAGDTHCLILTAHGTPALSATALLSFYGGEFLAPTWSVGVALANPSRIVTRAEIGDVIDGPVSAYSSTGTPVVKVTRVVFRRAGG